MAEPPRFSTIEANIEAMWVARNLKFYPLGLQEALKKEDKLKGAREYEVMLENKKPWHALFAIS